MTRPQWSQAALSVWGKTSSYDGEDFMPLVQHLTDSMQVASLVWDWLPRSARRTIDEALPLEARDGRVLLSWLAGVHDIGKASPPFASKVPPLADRMHERGLVLPRDLTDRSAAPHGLVGHAILADWLKRRYHSPKTIARTYAVVVGGHHGVPPTATKLRFLSPRPHLIGEGAWASVQDEILDEVSARAGASRFLDAWAAHPLTPEAQALLTGAVIVSDWLASNVDLFPFGWDESGERARAAWSLLALPAPWAPTETQQTTGQRLAARFPGLGDRARPVQEVTVAAARTAPTPPLLIVESAMGSGKTEAALLAAEVLAHRFDCGGLFFGLPTMATSDGMFGRVLTWIENLDGPATLSTHLAHGKASLNDDYAGLRRGRIAGVHDEAVPRSQTEAQVLAWLSGRKKGVLASMVVGTIDQLLFMALQAKHAALRHLGFAGKVVVVDEVHAADDFMRMFLCRALEWLAAYGVPVVLLSATLPSQQRQELADAYRSGLGLPPVPLDAPATYPLVTSVGAHGHAFGAPEGDGRITRVQVFSSPDDLDALSTLLDGWLTEGGCVAVIRNTVTRAQETFRHLRAQYGDDVVLHHSRFIATHRAAREAVLRDELGRVGARRPSRRIVVGTQVLEQSLDVDFDAMVTDLAPVDLILQRLGRLHRHDRPRPAALSAPQATITGITAWDADGVPVPDRGSQAVYGLSRLLRAAGALGLTQQGVTRQAHLPHDIRSLVERAYGGEAPVPTSWLEAAAAADTAYRTSLEESRRRADQFRMAAIPELQGSLLGWLEDSQSEAEDTRSQGSARVRDSEDGIEVIVTQRIGDEVRFIADGGPFAGRVLPSTGLGVPEPAVARALAATTVRLPASMTRREIDFEQTVTALEANAYEGWQQSHWLHGQLVLHFDAAWRARVGPFELTYDLDHGLSLAREETTP